MTRDEAAADLIGTILLVALAVVLAGLILSVVSDTLDAPSATRASFSLGAADVGATNASVLFRNGEIIPRSELRVGLARDAGVEEPVASFTTPNATSFKPGERLSFVLSPPMSANERITVRLYQNATNQLLAELSTRAGPAGATLSLATLEPSVFPAMLPNDSVSSSLVTVRVSHPQGALSIARVVVDLASIAPSLALDLNDAGEGGDAAGGDGNWSTLLRVPTTTPAGTYVIRMSATDVAGRVATTANVTLVVTANSVFAAQGAGTTTYGNVTNGSCYNCTVLGGYRVFEGTRFIVPSSQNVTALRVRNFTWDKLHPDRLDQDSAVFRIVDLNHSFSVVLYFDYSGTNDVATVKRLVLWTDANETVYVPRNGTGMPLQNLDLDILHPVTSLQWVRASGNADASAYYQNALVRDPATLIVEFMRDLEITGQKLPTEAMGLFTFDVVIY